MESTIYGLGSRVLVCMISATANDALLEEDKYPHHKR